MGRRGGGGGGGGAAALLYLRFEHDRWTVAASKPLASVQYIDWISKHRLSGAEVSIVWPRASIYFVQQ